MTIITDLLAVLSVLLLAALAAVTILFARYADKRKKLTSEIIDKNLFEKDALVKKIIVLEEEVKAINGRLEAANGALEEANALTE
ncbi:MAG: hypothetical protein M1276_01525 [Deltaproteobacteria bacterium]|nr:hypothetical protein [Deltaproteobacteria bacterium]